MLKEVRKGRIGLGEGDAFSALNVNTGEIFDEVTDIKENTWVDYRVCKEVSPTDEEILHEKESFKPYKYHVIIPQGNSTKLYKYLSNAEAMTFLLLFDYICFSDCVLRTGGSRHGDALSIKDLSKLADTNFNTLRTQMYSLKNKHVVGFHKANSVGNKNPWITVNPYLACKGDKIEKWVLDYYSEYTFGFDKNP